MSRESDPREGKVRKRRKDNKRGMFDKDLEGVDSAKV